MRIPCFLRCGLPAVLAALALSACGGSAAVAPPAPASVQTPVRTECAQEAWMKKPPPDDSRFLYFIGQSGRHATERDARDDAMVNATNSFVTYTGVDVSIVDQVLTQGQALSSAIQDPTISTDQRQKLRAQAFVSRVKAREFCTDEWRVTRGGQPQGEVYQVGVLVTVPIGELEHVRAAAKARAQARREQLQAKRDQLMNDASGFQAAAQSDEAAGRIVSALEDLASARRKLAAAAALGAEGPTPAGPSDAELQSAERRIVAGLELTARDPHQVVQPGDAPQDLAVVANYHGAQRDLPVPGLPVFFATPKAVAPPTQTDADGTATLSMRPLGKGQYSFLATVNKTPLEGKVSPDALASLAANRVTFQVDVQQPTTLEEFAQDLASNLARRMTEPVTVVMGSFTYGNTEEAGPFIESFKDDLNTALTHSPMFHVKAPTSRRGLTRGFEIVPADSPVTLARASDAKTVMFGDYSQQGDVVVVHASLKDQDDLMVASDAVRIPMSAIPADLPLVPPNYGQVKQTMQAFADAPGARQNDFRLDLWIDRGSGAVYRAGDHLYVNLRASRDCYLRLVYFDAGGNKILIFPNAFQRDNYIRAHQVVQIPSNDAGFDFTVQPPFGSEVVAAFASTKPFPRPNGKEIGNGMVLLSGDPESIVAHQRGIGVTASEGAQRAEAKVTLTTMAKGG